MTVEPTAPPSIRATPTDDSTARATRRSEDLVRLAHGMFVDRADWERSTEQERHLLVIRALVTRSKPGLVVSHASAVLLHGLPWIRPVPDRAQVIDPSRTTAQRTRFADKAAGRSRPVRTTERDGLLVTDLAATAVDVALRFDRGRALAVADAVLRRGVGREQLVAELDARGVVRTSRRARAVLELASPLADSAGESVTRLVTHDLGLPTPRLQQDFADARGYVGRVDLWFEEFGVVVEFDGMAKYRDRALRGARSAEDVVIAEKVREDRLRALPPVRSVARLTWRDVLPGGHAPGVLRAAGLPIARRFLVTPQW